VLRGHDRAGGVNTGRDEGGARQAATVRRHGRASLRPRAPLTLSCFNGGRATAPWTRGAVGARSCRGVDVGFRR